MTLLLLWQEYRELHPDDGYSYSHFCQRYKYWLGTQKRSMRQVHMPGRSASSLRGTAVPIVNENIGEFVKDRSLLPCWGHPAIRLLARLAIPNRGGLDLGPQSAFAFFGGITEIVVPDCLKFAAQGLKSSS